MIAPTQPPDGDDFSRAVDAGLWQRSTTDRRTTRGLVAAVVVIAATYVYFLLFAEFALLGLVQQAEGGGTPLRVVMAVLGVAGVAGSLAAARAFKVDRLKSSLVLGFGLCGVAAVVALIARRAGLGFAAAGVGLGLGWTTVTLAAGLRALVGESRLGWWCGAGTGTAYALCNVPAVFESSPESQTLIAVAAAVVGLGASAVLEVRACVARREDEFSRSAVISWIVILLALVWLDSAAFFVIQHAPDLKASTWEGAWRLAGNAATHLALALIAGWALDRGRTAWVAGIAGALLVGACLLLGAVHPATLASIPYAAGVSLYSVVLVFYPAMSGRPWVAAAIYAIAGWVGSGLGIGMATDLARIPPWFLAVAAVALSVALGWRRRLLAAAALMVIAVATPISTRATETPLVRLGREVYIAEGCIHCHSQYVRPRFAADVERWGPAQPLDRVLAAPPPLLGNRRQGPDLAEVGNRRSPEWQRLHLKDPRAVVPGSRMPGYAHLFEGDGQRGEALVAYLGSLGAETLAARVADNSSWRAEPRIDTPRGAARPARLFAELCANCHGASGRGDGVLAAELSVRPPDFSRDDWRRAQGDRDSVARIIKFGVPGTPMAGHEYLSDDDVVALAELIIDRHTAARTIP